MRLRAAGPAPLPEELPPCCGGAPHKPQYCSLGFKALQGCAAYIHGITELGAPCTSGRSSQSHIVGAHRMRNATAVTNRPDAADSILLEQTGPKMLCILCRARRPLP